VNQREFPGSCQYGISKNGTRSNVGQTDQRWLGRVEVQAAVIPASINAFGEGQDRQEIANKLLTCQPKTT